MYLKDWKSNASFTRDGCLNQVWGCFLSARLTYNYSMEFLHQTMVLRVHRVSRMYAYRPGICFLIKGMGIYLWVDKTPSKAHENREPQFTGSGRKVSRYVAHSIQKGVERTPRSRRRYAEADTVHALNNTVGTHRLMPTLFVLRVLPRLPSVSKQDVPAQKGTLRAAQTARLEYERILSTAMV